MALTSIHKQIHVTLILGNAPEQNATNIKSQVFQASNWNKNAYNAAQLVKRLLYNQTAILLVHIRGPTSSCFI